MREGEEKMEEIPLDGFFFSLYEKGELVYGMGKRQRFRKASVVNTCWTVIEAQLRVKEMICAFDLWGDSLRWLD